MRATMWAHRPKLVLAFVGCVLVMLLVLSTTTRDRENLPHLPFDGGQATSGRLPVSTSGHLAPSQQSHNEVLSVSRQDGQYWPIDFGEVCGINPNIIPHPNKTDVWIVVAQRMRPIDNAYGQWCVEIACEATFQKAALTCVDRPEILPISATHGGNCVGDTSILDWNIGPHDARVAYGPESPYIIYGSNSQFTCFGQWMQDFRALINWPVFLWAAHADLEHFVGKELQRPQFKPIEKNWFVFWDAGGEMYIHHDLTPKRSFVRMDKSGTIGEDLGPFAARNDEKCMAAYMPGPGEVEFHQASNSLGIVLCRRADPDCKDTGSNTYIMHIYQHKFWRGFHSVYEPYVALMHRTAPFEIYGLTKKPFWIHGRGGPGLGKVPQLYDEEMRKNWNQTEMFYVTSMNWKERGRNYVGYLDDVLMLGFGIEDERSGVIDFMASDLLKDLGLCSEA